MRRVDWWSNLAALAEDQGGLITAAQAQRVGARRPQLTELTNQRRLERIQHGVYQLAGAPVDSHTPIRAAWLALAPEATAAERLNSADPRGVISHRTAAQMHGLGDLDADRIEITTTARKRTRNPDVHLRRSSTLTPDSWSVRDGLPVTTIPATIASLAGDHLDAGHLATIARDALVDHHLPATALGDALAPAVERYGYTSEQLFLSDLLATAGVPRAVLEVATVTAVPDMAEALANTDAMKKLGTHFVEQMSAAWKESDVAKYLDASAIEALQPFFENLSSQVAVSLPPIPELKLPPDQKAIMAKALERAAASALKTTSEAGRES